MVVGLACAADVPSIISSKAGLKFMGKDVDAMRAVAKAHQDRSLQEFQARGRRLSDCDGIEVVFGWTLGMYLLLMQIVRPSLVVMLPGACHACMTWLC